MQSLKRTAALLLALSAGSVLVLGVPDGSGVLLRAAAAADTIPTNDDGHRHGRVTLEHANGETQVQAGYRDGLLHGTYREFNDAGQLILQAAFREGRLDGRLERRTDTGDRLEVCRYRDGQREGTRQVFADGQVVLTETYEDGQRTGQEGDASADPGPPVFAVGDHGFAGAEQAAPEDAPGPDAASPRGPARPAHQQDTSRKPNGYPYSIDEITRAFGRIDELRIEGGPDEQQAAAIRRLIKYRLVCGLANPIVAFDREEAILAQRASEVCHALGRLSHEPPNPGLPEDIYQQGAEGAIRSNLGRGVPPNPGFSIEGWMVDGGFNNRDEVGHRRWCLAPGLYETAYGYHEGYGSLLVSGNTRDGVEYDYLAFPGIGFQPVEYYDNLQRRGAEHLIWTVHLNPAVYNTPESIDRLRVTVYEVLDDGTREAVEIERTHIAEKPLPLDAILFTPVIDEFAPGTVYEVNVQGLERSRRPFTLTYRVEFFTLGEQ